MKKHAVWCPDCQIWTDANHPYLCSECKEEFATKDIIAIHKAKKHSGILKRFIKHLGDMGVSSPGDSM